MGDVLLLVRQGDGGGDDVEGCRQKENVEELGKKIGECRSVAF